MQLNFAKYRQQLKGLRKTTANVQVVGFTDGDTHRDVLTKGANGLGVKCDINLLSLVCSSGIVPDTKICDHPWTLGEYIHLNGGVQNRSKKTWGILIPVDDEDTTKCSSTADSVYIRPSNFLLNWLCLLTLGC